MRRMGWSGWVFVLMGCRSAPAPAPAVSEPLPRDPVTDETSATIVRAGFVVFLDDESYVLPLAADAKVQRYPGWFVGDGSGAGVVLTELSLQDAWDGPALRLPYCVDEITSKSCGRLDEQESISVKATLSPGKTILEPRDDCDCISVEGISDDGPERSLAARLEAYGIDEDELEMSDLGLEQYVAECYEGSPVLPPVSIASGVVHRHDMLSSLDCSGLNTYSLESAVQELRSSTWDGVEVDAGFRCGEEFDFAFVRAGEVDLEDGCRFGDDDCAVR